MRKSSKRAPAGSPGDIASVRGLAAVRRSLDAIARANDDLAAFLIVTAEQALAEAEAQEASSQMGLPGGPLAGLPIAVKDIIDLRGHPTRAGSKTRAQVPPAEKDAFVVAKLRAAGAIVVGKTNTVEYAFGGWGTNHAVGTPKNPWDRTVHRTPGGSSSGTGVAVGAGLVPAALGTDTGGSVRLPAAFCGCVGLKTSIGLVSRAGVVPLSATLDTIGPLAHSVQLCAEMLDVMQGYDRDDPSTHGVVPVDPLRDLDRGISGFRIGRLTEDQMPRMTPHIKASFETSLKLLEKAGATIEPFRLPISLEDYTLRRAVLMVPDAYAAHQPLVDDAASSLHPDIRGRMATAKSMSAADHVRALDQRQTDIDQFLWAMDRLDAIVLPSTFTTALPLSEVDESVTPAFHTRFVNHLALAALSLPIGLSPSGLPTSLQIVVRRFHDPLAIRIVRAFEIVRGAFPAPPA
jgi:aspartyl-tRNA(Asn)/glutamyl-tRNA(Gln) amidotransferase subunit A